MSVGGSDWYAANQAYLLAALDRVRRGVERSLGRPIGPATGQPAGASPRELAAAMPQPPALERLATSFGLSPFERDLLLLCAGTELDTGFAAVCQEALGGRRNPTFSLALAALDDPHWSSLAPTAPLRYWKMIEVGPGEALVSSPLRIDERILHYVAGVSYPDERLLGLTEPWPAPGELPPSQLAVAEQIAARWSGQGDGAAGAWTAVQLCGEPDAGLRDVAAAACARSGLGLHLVRAADLPAGSAERDLTIRLLDREAVLDNRGLLVMLDDDGPETLRAAAAFVERVRGALLVGGREPLRLPYRTLPVFDVAKPTAAEQGELWRRALGPLAGRLDGQIGRLVDQFDLGDQAIMAAAASLAPDGAGDPQATAARLWQTCRTQSRARLDDLAQRVETGAGWDDLVLPPLQLQVLRQIVAQVRQRGQVYERWGFAAKSSRGLGISALFAGPSGTGKTLAAEILANELHLDLYRIDLSQVVSKYIGETEKNLRRVFDAAQTAGAVLLFDEADALFGKRSEVKDSHDRYANIEVSYLLQRMEAYRGLAILTTNMKQALDTAFTRRIRFVVQFPFPDAHERAEIWRRVFPRQTPTEGLDVDRLARLNVAGGNIRNIALGAAFLAADADDRVRMAHLLDAARAEYAKLDRPLTESEIAGWV
jgi:vesicle-fusing ATPase